MPELRQKTEPREPGLTTSDLANLNEPTSNQDTRTAGEIDQKEFDRIDLQRRESLDADTSAIDRRSAGRMQAPDAASQAGRMQTSDSASQNETAPLFSPDEAKEFHSRWDAIQVSFVDEPRQAVQQADGLVANAMKRLAEIFAQERGNLDQQWDRGGDVSTEDLRVALRRYRSFFGRLLSV